MAELKPCPFCGGKDTGVLTTSYDGYWYAVFCENCMAHTRKCRKEEDAIEAWNKRTEPERPKGRWVEADEDFCDAYLHNKCSNCGAVAPFDYKMQEDWDEGMDGEYYSLGLIDVGINEHITPFCPNCGADMRGTDNDV